MPTFSFMGQGVQRNNLFVELESSLDSRHYYTGGVLLEEKVKCVTLHDFWSLCLLPCMQIIKEESRTNNMIGVFFGYT